MPTALKEIKGKELVKKILKGERDFSKIRLEEGFNFNKYKDFEEMQDYLKKQDLYENPIVINGSEFRFIKARGLYLRFVSGIYAYLEGANFEGADLFGADLRGANLSGVNFEGADLCGADLRRVRNLSDAINLDYAIFRETRVTKKEKEIIEEALKRREFFILDE